MRVPGFEHCSAVFIGPNHPDFDGTNQFLVRGDGACLLVTPADGELLVCGTVCGLSIEAAVADFSSLYMAVFEAAASREWEVNYTDAALSAYTPASDEFSCMVADDTVLEVGESANEIPFVSLVQGENEWTVCGDRASGFTI